MDDRSIALVDCDSFYASCERAFRPDLVRTPIVVLSNNDGCIIARCPLAKPFVKMGEPYFKVRSVLERNRVAVFSSNYGLYGDVSDRVMAVLESQVPYLEVYSIDEAWADLTGIPEPLADLGHTLRASVLRSTGIPVGIGIATTKTLAKLANAGAKRWQAHTGGVLDIREPERRDKLLKAMPVGEVWGIGRKLETHLAKMGIQTAWQLAEADSAMIRKRFSVLVEQTVRELRGTRCLDWEPAAPAKKEICASRAFGSRVHELSIIKESVAHHAARVAEKLRSQGSVCSTLAVGIRTGLFNPNEPRYTNSITCKLPYPSDDTRLLVATATAGAEAIFRDGYAYAKASVMGLGLCQKGEYTPDLLAPQPSASNDKLMSVIDQANAKWGRGTLRPARIRQESSWKMERRMLSPSYTTSLDGLMVAFAR